MNEPIAAPPEEWSSEVFQDIQELIEQARKRTAQTVNTELTMLYWHIGLILRTRVLGDCQYQLKFPQKCQLKIPHFECYLRARRPC